MEMSEQDQVDESMKELIRKAEMISALLGDQPFAPLNKKLFYRNTYEAIENAKHMANTYCQNAPSSPVLLIPGVDFNTPDQIDRFYWLERKLSNDNRDLLRKLPLRYVAGVRPVGVDPIYVTASKTLAGDRYMCIYVDLPAAEQTSQEVLDHLLISKFQILIPYVTSRLEKIYGLDDLEKSELVPANTPTSDEDGPAEGDSEDHDRRAYYRELLRKFHIYTDGLARGWPISKAVLSTLIYRLDLPYVSQITAAGIADMVNYKGNMASHQRANAQDLLRLCEPDLLGAINDVYEPKEAAKICEALLFTTRIFFFDSQAIQRIRMIGPNKAERICKALQDPSIRSRLFTEAIRRLSLVEAEGD